MEEREVINRVRSLHFIFGLLANQQSDPRCAVCKSRASVYEDVLEEWEELKRKLQERTVPEPFSRLLTRIEELLSALKMPKDPVPQRKEGKCFFAERKCLVKECFEVYEDLLEED